ncbi:MAG: transcriptional regulator GutM [Eubacterium sp.]
MKNPNGLMVLAFFAFGMMILQSLLSYLQYKNYQKAVDSLRGNGWVLGIGMRKGGFNLNGGAIIILAWDQARNTVCTCKRLQGIALWKRFESVDTYNGMTLDEVRQQGIVEDLKINQKRREKESYSPLLVDKRRKKGALIQAVEAIDKRLAREMTQAEKGCDSAETKQEERERIEARKREIRKKQLHQDH